MTRHIYVPLIIVLAISLASCTSELEERGGNAEGKASNVTSLSVVAASTTQIDLSWQNPTEAEFSRVQIRFNQDTGNYPGNVTEGTEAYSGTGNSFSHTGLSCGSTYYYTVFSIDTDGNSSSGVQGQVKASDTNGGCTTTL